MTTRLGRRATALLVTEADAGTGRLEGVDDQGHLITATEPDLLLGHDQQPTGQAKAAMVIPYPKRLNVATSTPPLPGQAAAQATLVVAADDNAHHLAAGVASRRHGEALICQHVRTAQRSPGAWSGRWLAWWEPPRPSYSGSSRCCKDERRRSLQDRVRPRMRRHPAVPVRRRRSWSGRSRKNRSDSSPGLACSRRWTRQGRGQLPVGELLAAEEAGQYPRGVAAAVLFSLESIRAGERGVACGA